MAVYRFQFDDPYDSDSDTNTYVFPRNPREMTSPLPGRALSTASTTAGQLLAWEGGAIAESWQIKGPTVDSAQYAAFVMWSKKPNRFLVTDHFGRVMTVLPTKFEHTPSARPKNYWAGDYAWTFTVLAVSSPTVGDIWS